MLAYATTTRRIPHQPSASKSKRIIRLYGRAVDRYVQNHGVGIGEEWGGRGVSGKADDCRSFIDRLYKGLFGLLRTIPMPKRSCEEVVMDHNPDFSV